MHDITGSVDPMQYFCTLRRVQAVGYTIYICNDDAQSSVRRGTRAAFILGLRECRQRATDA